VISPSQTPVPTQDNKTQKDEVKVHALSGIRTHDFSVKAIKTYASDRAANGTGPKYFLQYFALEHPQSMFLS
jgi:thiamine monophosphate kinase